MSFVGFIRVCLQAPGDAQLDDVLGPIRTRYKSEHAIGDPPKDRGVVFMVAKFAFLMARARLTGAYKNSPFFSDAGVSIATPKVLTSAEHEELYRLV